MNEQLLEMQASTIEQMKSIQTQVLDVNERIADTVVDMIPEVPESVADFWNPTAMMANYIDFWTEVRTANHNFAKAMLSPWMPAEADKATSKN